MASGASPPRGMDERRHLARDEHEHAIKLLDALNATWTAGGRSVDTKHRRSSHLKTKAMPKQGER